MDAISSLGCIDLPVDKWGCDLVVTGSQKGWMVPPGLAFVSVSERAWQAHKVAKMPRFYWDFAQARDFLQKNHAPWTPAVSIFYTLDVALPLMLDEGLPNIFSRHARLGQKTRDGVKSLGLTLYADEKCASNTVTAVNAPSGIDGKKMQEIMREEHGIVLSGGQSTLAGKISRIGHLGYVTDSDKVVVHHLRDSSPLQINAFASNEKAVNNSLASGQTLELQNMLSIHLFAISPLVCSTKK